jgi:NDP-sugar pyrophosphorylase family protein
MSGLPGAGQPDTAVILAGGLGTRLRPAVSSQPKVLVPVAGRPFLAYVLDHLSRSGIRRAILCTGYLASQVEEFAGDGARWGLNIQYSQEEAPLGTAGAVRQACAGLDRPFFALNGDTLFLASLSGLWAAHREAGTALATIALLPREDGQASGCVKLDETGRIIAFDEKPESGGHSPVLVNGGIYVLDSQALAGLPAGQPASLEKQVFPALAAESRLAGLVLPAYFADIGTPDSLAAFTRDVQSGKIALAGE